MGRIRTPLDDFDDGIKNVRELLAEHGSGSLGEKIGQSFRTTARTAKLEPEQKDQLYREGSGILAGVYMKLTRIYSGTADPEKDEIDITGIVDSAVQNFTQKAQSIGRGTAEAAL